MLIIIYNYAISNDVTVLCYQLNVVMQYARLQIEASEYINNNINNNIIYTHLLIMR